jgi:FdhD protein
MSTSSRPAALVLPTAPHPTVALAGGLVSHNLDHLAVEAPLEIRLQQAGPASDGALPRPLAITMRTPGADLELVAGFLFAEGIVGERADVLGLAATGPDTVEVTLAPGRPLPDAAAPDSARRFTVTSACGVCGKGSLDALTVMPPFLPPPPATPLLEPALLLALPDRLRAAQPAFAATGGLHAAGLFDADGRLLCAREDVGRHNAVDKVVGARLLAGELPAHEQILLVSGRASFELVQKAVMAAIPVLAAVGAPSTAAATLAAAHGLTLVGFVRDQRFNVYAGAERLRLPAETGGGRPDAGRPGDRPGPPGPS